MVNSPCLVRKAPSSPRNHPERKNGYHPRDHLKMISVDIAKYARLTSIGKQERNPELWDLFIRERSNSLEEKESEPTELNDEMCDNHVTEIVNNNNSPTRESPELGSIGSKKEPKLSMNNTEQMTLPETTNNVPTQTTAVPEVNRSRRSVGTRKNNHTRERPKILLEVQKPNFIPIRLPLGPDGTKGFHLARSRILKV